MPVVRMPQDNSLAETLGGLGQSLTNMWNPKTRMEIYMLQQRMAMEQEQVMLARKKEAARELALRHFSFLDRNDQGVIEGMIYSDQPMDQILATGARLANKGKQLDGAPSDVRIRAWNEMYPGSPWKEAGAPIFGPKDQAEEAQRVITAKGAETTATENARFGAADAHTRKILNDPNYPKPGDISPDALQRRARAYADLHPTEKDLPNDGIIPDGSPEVARLIANRKAGMTYDEARLKEQALQDVRGIGGDKPTIGGTGSGVQPPAFSSFNTGGGTGTPGAPGAPAVGGAGAQDEYLPPDPTRPYANQVPLIRRGTGGTVYRGYYPGEQEQKSKDDEARRTQLAGFHDQGEAGMKLMGHIEQIRRLNQILDQMGISQADRVAMKKVIDTGGLIEGPAMEALKGIDMLINGEIPNLRQQMGNMRMAGPEFQAMYKMIGDGTLPPGDMNTLLANQQMLAEFAMDRRKLAARALGYSYAGAPVSWDEFQRQDNDLINKMNQVNQQILTDWHGVAAKYPKEASEALQAAAARPYETQRPGDTATAQAPQAPAAAPAAAAPAAAPPAEAAPAAPTARAETPAPVTPAPEAGSGGFMSWLFGGGQSSAAPAAPAPAAPAAPTLYRSPNDWNVNGDGTVTPVPRPGG